MVHTKEQAHWQCGSLDIPGLKEGEDSVSNINIGGDWLCRDAGNSQELDPLLDPVIGDQGQRVDPCLDFFRFLGCQRDPDGDWCTCQA